MTDAPIIYTKEVLIERFKEIAAAGWIANARHGNQGGIGNTLEDLLGIKENNLPIPNAAEWELKTQALHTTSLTTLFHLEPSPRALKWVSQILLPKYGWAHQEDGKKYPAGELSFRQTINGQGRTDRGFMVIVDRKAQKVLISFDASKVAERHRQWLRSVQKRAGLGELDPQPYWGFDDLKHKAGTKLPNTFYVQAAVKRDADRVFFKYEKVTMLRQFSFAGFLRALETGKVLVDFDARSGHNHGTKFRLRQDCLPMLYKDQNVVIH
jgi:hypothetical protein